MSERTDSLWHNFFELSLALSKNIEESFFNIYEKILEKVWKEKLSKEEQRMFLNAGKESHFG